MCIGDVFAVGEALVQVSQPRQPCWKLARRLGAEGSHGPGAAERAGAVGTCESLAKGLSRRASRWSSASSPLPALDGRPGQRPDVPATGGPGRPGGPGRMPAALVELA